MISIHIFSYDSEASNMSTLCEISAPKLPLSMVYFYYHITILFVWIAEKSVPKIIALPLSDSWILSNVQFRLLKNTQIRLFFCPHFKES